MPLSYGNRIKVNASGTPGTSDFVLGTAVSGYQSFVAAIPTITTGFTVRYVIEESADWEIGLGTYNTTGPKIARTTVIQSSAGGTTLVNFTSAATIMVSVANGDFVATDASVFTGAITEAVYALTGTTPALNPANGTIQTWTLSANSTPTDGLAAGQSITLMIDDGTARTITWPSVTWKTNSGTAPILNTSGFTAIVLWKVGSVLYGARVGNN
jgi:hypothetical protein